MTRPNNDDDTVPSPVDPLEMRDTERVAPNRYTVRVKLPGGGSRDFVAFNERDIERIRAQQGKDVSVQIIDHWKDDAEQGG
jgi:hypothetical protein